MKSLVVLNRGAEAMIVSDAFADDSTEIAWQQHDVYGEALSIIIRICRQKALHAAIILGVEPPKGATSDARIDHRTLQMVHDIIAAAWRFRTNASQNRLPFDASAPLSMNSWLTWLTEEVLSWDNEPVLIRCVIQILGNPNSEPGYLAENELVIALFNRYRDVLWKESWMARKEQLSRPGN